jgi:hypothetical protein
VFALTSDDEVEDDESGLIEDEASTGFNLTDLSICGENGAMLDKDANELVEVKEGAFAISSTSVDEMEKSAMFFDLQIICSTLFDDIVDVADFFNLTSFNMFAEKGSALDDVISFLSVVIISFDAPSDCSAGDDVALA